MQSLNMWGLNDVRWFFLDIYGGIVLEFKKKVWVQILINGSAGSTNQKPTWVKGILVIEKSVGADLN